jgi:hypothetical protein
MEFYKTPEWIKLKTQTVKTEKLLTRTEYLKEVGYKNYSDEKYIEYLKIMREK